jgi:predicted protein tyrosine phosphatase
MRLQDSTEFSVSEYPYITIRDRPKILTHCGPGIARSGALNTVIQLSYFVSLKIHNKFADD